MVIELFEVKRVRQHGSIARRDLVDVSIGVGDETLYLGRAISEADMDVDPACVDCGTHRIAAPAGYEVHIHFSRDIDTVGRGKRLAIVQISGLAVDTKR